MRFYKKAYKFSFYRNQLDPVQIFPKNFPLWADGSLVSVSCEPEQQRWFKQWMDAAFQNTFSVGPLQAFFLKKHRALHSYSVVTLEALSSMRKPRDAQFSALHLTQWRLSAALRTYQTWLLEWTIKSSLQKSPHLFIQTVSVFNVFLKADTEWAVVTFCACRTFSEKCILK